MSSVNRDLAKSMGAANAAGTLTSTGEVAGSAGMTVVTTADSLPTSGNAGDRAFVDSSNRYYIHSGSGWYNIALINTTPEFSSIVTSNNDSVTSSPFALSDEGSTTVITITATDPEGVPITYTATTDAGFDSLATISQNGQVFTITPFSEDSAVTSSGTVTFRASDGVNVATALRTFTLSFAPPQFTGYNALLLKADNDAAANPTDASSNNFSITTVGTQAEAFSGHHPFGGGYSYYFTGTNTRINSNANNRWDIGTGDFTLEGWYYYDGANGMLIHSAYWSGGNNRGYYLRGSGSALRLQASQGSWNSFPNVFNLSSFFKLNAWTHFSVNRESGVIKVYRNGCLFHTQTYTASLNQTGGSSGNRACVIGARYSDGNYTMYNRGNFRDFVIDTGTAIRTGDFTPPSGMTGVDDQVTLTSSCKAYLMKGTNKYWDIDHGPNALGYTFFNMHGGGRFPPQGDYQNWSKTSHGGSYYFDGTTSPYFKVDANSGLALGTGDFTIECWFKPRQLNKYHSLLDSRSTDNQAVPLLWLHTNNYFYYYVSNGSRIQSSTFVRKNIWYHVMVTRSNNVTRMFVNGHYQAQWSDTTNYVQGGDWFFGQRYTVGSAYSAQGYLKDFRVKTVASATTNDNITVPTRRLTADSDTILLVAGDTTGEIFDVTGGHNDIRANMAQGDASASTTQTKYADASMAFDGTGDYLSVSDGTNLDFSNSINGGSASYTLETWVYPTNLSGSSTWRTICNNGTSGNYAPMYLTMLSDKLHYLSSHNETSYVMDTRTDIGSSGIHTMSANTWQHVAVTWNKNHYSFFVDGNFKGSYYKSGNPMDPNYDLGVGARDDGNEPFSGYLEDFRITKRLSRYPFIPPMETLTSDANTSLLVGHASSFTDGSSNSHTVVNNGNAAVSNWSPHPTMKSIYVDGGSGHHVQIANSTDFQLSNTTSSWQMEYYVYSLSASGLGTHAACWDQIANVDDWIVANNSGAIVFYIASHSNSSTLLSSASIFEANKWYHVAIVNDTTNIIMYVDGTRVTSAATPSTVTTSGSVFRLGRYGNANNDGPFNGYISNFRFKKGGYDYTSNFTPPTEALTG